VNTLGRRAALAIAVALADWVTALVIGALHVPFFLDSWATSAGVIAGGLGVGIVGGVLYNALMAATAWGTGAWVWAASSVLVACSTWAFRRAGWIDIERPFRLMAAGMLTGLANACVATAILTFMVGVPDDPNTRAFRDALRSVLGNGPASLLVQEMVIEVADKTVSLISAAAVVVLVFERSPSASARRA
jgi:hypothetical protein